LLSQKCQYAIRSVFELAKNAGNQPLKTSAIAKSQAIPIRFLEVILNQLRQGGFVESKRGNAGGYYLSRFPAQITVGEIIAFVEGPLGPVSCIPGGGDLDCPLRDDCVFMSLWERVKKAESDIYFGTTFQDLIDQEVRMKNEYIPKYTI
jgi:Rrf2 family transcriptional regulator, cysteine metabolism repressor